MTFDSVFDAVKSTVVLIILLLVGINLLILAVGLVRHKPWRSDGPIPKRIEFKALSLPVSEEFAKAMRGHQTMIIPTELKEADVRSDDDRPSDVPG